MQKLNPIFILLLLSQPSTTLMAQSNPKFLSTKSVNTKNLLNNFNNYLSKFQYNKQEIKDNDYIIRMWSGFGYETVSCKSFSKINTEFTVTEFSYTKTNPPIVCKKNLVGNFEHISAKIKNICFSNFDSNLIDLQELAIEDSKLECIEILDKSHHLIIAMHDSKLNKSKYHESMQKILIMFDSVFDNSSAPTDCHQ